MAMNFPASPALNDIYTYNGRSWRWDGSSWTAYNLIGGTGFYENVSTLTVNYTVGTGNNAMTAGPITIASGVTITVPSGSTWTVV